MNVKEGGGADVQQFYRPAEDEDRFLFSRLSFAKTWRKRVLVVGGS